MWNYLPAIRFLSVATKCKSSTKTSCIKRRCWLLTERPKTADNGFKSCWQRTKKNWRKISRRSTKKQKSTEEVSDAWMGMLIEAPLYVASLPIWQSWNCGGPIHLDIKSKHAEDSRTLRSLSRTTYHMYQSYTPIMNCMELCCGSTPSSRCENLHESHQVACKG